MGISHYSTREENYRVQVTFKAKYKLNGEIEIYKNRLVAKGLSQNFKSDYDETPVVTYTTIRPFLAYSGYKKSQHKLYRCFCC